MEALVSIIMRESLHFARHERRKNMRTRLEDMTLREKLGQTGQPSPSALQDGVKRCGGYGAYFKENPFGSFWLSESCKKPDGTPFESPAEMGEAMREINDHIKIPLLITADFENGCETLFPQLHPCGTNLEMGAAASRTDLIYKRAYYWARELRSCGVNNPYGPVNDLHKNFFSAGIMRKISDDWKIVAKVHEALIKGIQDAGIAACCKHYPGLPMTTVMPTSAPVARICLWMLGMPTSSIFLSLLPKPVL